MASKQYSPLPAIALIVLGVGGAAFTLVNGALFFPFLFLAVAAFGVGTYTDSYRLTILSLAIGVCVTVLTAGARFVFYGSLDLLTALLGVLAAAIVWKIIRTKKTKSGKLNICTVVDELSQ